MQTFFTVFEDLSGYKIIWNENSLCHNYFRHIIPATLSKIIAMIIMFSKNEMYIFEGIILYRTIFRELIYTEIKVFNMSIKNSKADFVDLIFSMPKAYNCWFAFVPYLIIAGSKQHNNITIKSILFFVDCKKMIFPSSHHVIFRRLQLIHFLVHLRLQLISNKLLVINIPLFSIFI